MSKNYNKTITREIRKSFGRFAAIIAIVALGVGFLVGILSSTPDMKATATEYYSEYAMSDFDLKSTLGFTEKDIKAIQEIPEVTEVMPARVMDSLVSINKDTTVAGRIYGLDLDNITINKLQLKEGRMPENKNECVIETPTVNLENVTIGDTITVSKENEDVDDTYAQKKFKVVGIVDNPYYFCTSREPSSVGTGRVGVIMYTSEKAYKTEVYTDLFLLTSNPYGGFCDEYDDFIDAVTEKIEAVSDERIPARHDEVIGEAMEEIDDAKATLAEEKAKVEKELTDAEKELADGQKEYDNGIKEIAKAKAELDDAEEKIAASKKEISSGKSQLADAQKKLDESKAQLDAVKADVEAAKAAQAAGYPLPDEVLQQIAAYDAGVAQWEAGRKQLREKSAQLTKAAATIAESEAQIAEGREEIASNEKKMQEAEAELSSGRNELAEGRAEAKAEFADAEAEIADAEQEVLEIEIPEWYILDRHSNVSYAKYSIDVEKVAAIATVFPIFFFLVAALVSLTTMTRMVEEERIQIGTLKALGYRKIKIMSKYLIYCGVATAIGCIIGLLAGFQVLPPLIFMAFESQYLLPPLVMEIHPTYAIMSCGLEILCTLGATWMACYQTLREKPSELMVPRAPKAGKRILLERLTFFWNKLSFTYKATARNIFRYKKHLLMTVIGVAGCTALMVAGLGVQDSLTALVKTQFDDILKYDMKIDLTDEERDDTLNAFIQDKDALYLMSSTYDIESDNNREIITATLFVPQKPDQLKDYVVLRDRKTHDPVTFENDSLIISEKMADTLEVDPGDIIEITDSDGANAKFTLTGTTEHYAGCYIYMAPDLYKQTFGTPDYNCYLLNAGITGPENQDKVSSQLQKSDAVSSVEFMSQSKEGYQTVLDSLSFLVYVLILFAGLLAIVVLYNLTNININERLRELATLRVLGYQHKEVALYIFREIGILTLLGTIVGLLLGKALHYYIVIIGESTDMVFGRELDTSTFILAAVFTIFFSLLVDVLMLGKLKKIDMAASMKAVD